MAGRRHHPRSRRRAFGPRGHAMGERAPRYPRPRDAWEAAELEALEQAADMEAAREAARAALERMFRDEWE